MCVVICFMYGFVLKFFFGAYKLIFDEEFRRRAKVMGFSVSLFGC